MTIKRFFDFRVVLRGKWNARLEPRVSMLLDYPKQVIRQRNVPGAVDRQTPRPSSLLSFFENFPPSRTIRVCGGHTRFTAACLGFNPGTPP